MEECSGRILSSGHFALSVGICAREILRPRRPRRPSESTTNASASAHDFGQSARGVLYQRTRTPLFPPDAPSFMNFQLRLVDYLLSIRSPEGLWHGHSKDEDGQQVTVYYAPRSSDSWRSCYRERSTFCDTVSG